MTTAPLVESIDAVDLDEIYGGPRNPPADRPWVMVNMIASIDGATVLDGTSGGLGGAGDRAVFAAIRAQADLVLAGSATVIAERYRPASLDAERRDRRIAAGRAPVPRIAVVTAQGRLDPDLPLFDSDPPPLVITTPAGADEARARLGQRAEMLVARSDRVELASVLRARRGQGDEIVLSEGGPTLNGSLAREGLIDELCVTIAPRIVGGTSRRIIHGELHRTTELTLRSALHDESGYLFLRYCRAGSAPG